ncbi:MAG: hypothetical protein NTX23_03520 [Candidatus Bipolaricaulota bacterium]|nr:hypothetical protein [Candidatus Bipolaricaulota bacterium]
MKTRSFGLAGILVLAVAFGGLAGEVFTGSWEAEIGLSPQQTQPFTTFQSSLDVGLCLGFLTLNSVSDFVIDGWIWEELGLRADVGLLAFDGHMLYDPQTGSMLYAEGVLSLCAGPLTASLYGAVTGATQSESANYGYVLDIKGVVFGGGFTFESATYLGADLSGISFTASGSASDSPLLTKTFVTDPTIDPVTAVFSGEDVTFSGTMFGCITLTSLASFSTEGFESEQITAEFRELFGIPLTMTLDLIYEVQTKSFVFTPSMETDFGCLSLYSHIVSSGGVISGLELYGIKFTATIGAATLQSISNLDTSTYVITTPEYGSIVESLGDAMAGGHVYYPQGYWEALSLTVGIPPIGAGFSFSVQTFLTTSDGLLFDWAESTMGITLALGSSVSTSTSITVDATGFTGWSLSFRVSW